MTDTIAELLAGRWIDPDTDEYVRVPVKAVHVAKSLAGDEAGLVKALGLPPPFAIITDQNTYEALGRRVEEALESLGPIIPIRLAGRPHPDERTAAKIMRELGIETSALGVARYYGKRVDGWIIDTQDAALTPALTALGCRVECIDTLMTSPDKSRQVAAAAVAFARRLARKP